VAKFALRSYQREAIHAVLNARRRGIRRQVIALPTGAGKTVIFSELARLANKDVLVLAHRDELVHQAKDKLERAGVGQVSIEQGPNQADPNTRVVVCSIRSLQTTRLNRLISGRNVGLVIYDECHHAPAEDNKRVLKDLGAFEPNWGGTLVGFTATTMRGDGIGLESVFEEIVYDRSLPEMIDDGYLVPLRGFRITTSADLSGICGGADFPIDELEEVVNIEDRNALVARSIQELARDRRTIVFCVSVAHAKALARALNVLRIPAAPVYGAMKRDMRATILQQFREGKITVITNVAVLTEGFDDPEVSCIAMARPTRSSGLYAQCVGRGTRPYPEKTDCLILDFVDVSAMSVVTLPTLMGMPRQLDLQGEDVREALAQFHQFAFDYPNFSIEAESITLSEIKERAESFDPLTLDVDPNIVAITQYAWVSLGNTGLGLHLLEKNNQMREYLILARGRGSQRYHVLVNRKKVAAFARLEAAVMATDYELGRLGLHCQETALPSASWRFEPVDQNLQRQLSMLRPPRRAGTVGDAIRLLLYAEFSNRQVIR